MENGKPQWLMTVEVWHGPTFGHSVEVRTTSANRKVDTHDTITTWRGLGIPANDLALVEATVVAIVSEHLVTRYGCSDELPHKWAGEPDPF